MPNEFVGENERGRSPLAVADGVPQILCLGGSSKHLDAIREQFSESIRIVSVASPLRAMAELSRGGYIGVYADADHFTAAFEAGRILQNQRVLAGMPDAVLLMNPDNTLIWGNGRLAEWSGRDDVVGANFYDLLDDPEILGPKFCPFRTALTLGRPSTSTLRCRDNRVFRVNAAPLFDNGAPSHLVVTIRDITSEYHEQQKLANIHQAGIELADLTPDEVAEMDFRDRIELLKDNILRCTQDVLHFDVVEIRMLDQNTGMLEPLLAVGMKPEAEARQLRAAVEGNGVTGFVAATGRSYLCEDTSRDTLFLEGCHGARSSLTVPLMLHDEVIGTFNVESPEPNAFTESDRKFLEIFSRDVAVALNTLELLAAEKATTAAASIEAIHSAVAMPIDVILNDAVNIMERYIGHEPEVVERLQHILQNARDIKQVIHKVGQAMAPTEARPQGLRSEPRPQLVGKRILVVDEDEAVRSAAHGLLERYHCVIETAQDGNQAIYMCRNLLASQSYDAIIADIRLPDMSGHQLMVKLGEVMGKVPMILMTGFGYDPGHSIVKARQAGLKHVLYKPFRLDQLLEAVEQTVAPPAAS